MMTMCTLVCKHIINFSEKYKKVRFVLKPFVFARFVIISLSTRVIESYVIYKHACTSYGHLIDLLSFWAE